MNKSKGKRGRPPVPHPKTPAERMRAYRQRKREAGLKNVRRWVPADDDGTRRYSDHRVLDARSLAMHCMIAQKIERDPDLLKIPKRNIARWIKKSIRPLPEYLQEWQEILDRPWPEIADLITSMNDEATRLRSSSPFAGVLNDKERNQIYAAFRA